MTTISPLAIDMYLPAFDQMAAELNTDVGLIALSLSSYFVGLACGQLLYGPVLDRYGRKRPVYFGLTLFVLASIGCMLVTTVEGLIALRFLQALGGCVAQVAAVAMVRDFFPLKDRTKVFSMLVLILGVSPLLAPTVGSWVAVTLGWHAVFIFLGVIASGILAATYFLLPEGHQPDPTVSLKFKPIVKNFLGILKDPQFSTYALSGAFAFSGLLVYVAASPIIFMTHYHLNATEYGMIFAGLSVGFIGAAQINIWLSKRFNSHQIYFGGILAQIFFAWSFLLGTIFFGYSLVGTIILLFGFLSSIGFMNPNAAALALAPFSRNAGSAASLMGFLQIGVAALASSGVGFFDAEAAFLPITALMAGTSTTGLILLLFGKFRHRDAFAAMAIGESETEAAARGFH